LSKSIGIIVIEININNIYVDSLEMLEKGVKIGLTDLKKKNCSDFGFVMHKMIEEERKRLQRLKECR